MQIGDKAIAKNGFHMFESDEEVVFIGMNYDHEEPIYMFKNEEGFVQPAYENEFILVEVQCDFRKIVEFNKNLQQAMDILLRAERFIYDCNTIDNSHKRGFADSMHNLLSVHEEMTYLEERGK